MKKPNPLYEGIRFDTMGGKSIEILHIGAFDDEPVSFEKMVQFAKIEKICNKEWQSSLFWTIIVFGIFHGR